MPWDAIVKHAIQNRLLLEFNYHGFPRVVEPHVYGLKNGRFGILGYQVGGASKSGSIPDWRRFEFDDMQVVVATNRTFAGPRPTPTGRHSAWDRTLMIVQ